MVRPVGDDGADSRGVSRQPLDHCESNLSSDPVALPLRRHGYRVDVVELTLAAALLRPSPARGRSDRVILQRRWNGRNAERPVAAGRVAQRPPVRSARASDPHPVSIRS